MDNIDNFDSRLIGDALSVESMYSEGNNSIFGVCVCITIKIYIIWGLFELRVVLQLTWFTVEPSCVVFEILEGQEFDLWMSRCPIIKNV